MKTSFWALGAGILLWSGCQSTPERLPVLGPREVATRMVNGQEVEDTIYKTIPAFQFTDQEGETVTTDDFDDKVYVADFFFTTCQSICPIMSKQMLRVYKAYEDNDQVSFISHTVDPGYDSVAVLRDYADKLGVDNSDKWHFVTGEKDDIFSMSREAYLVPVQDDPERGVESLDHSGKLILIDKDRRIRGYYDGTDAADVDQLIHDIDLLLQEYETNS
ncbi:protein SCO1/2 [Catalinimonas alkaloidigena]|uniref:Protein SCO1/2 n=1 Tax=Catalinimonas alkaloidigena TaxID=1075417 RepID=A0A1G9GR12_9BACT|nr:SCO family protein [Catalinimonas alkaloidigena]SDL02723.1 protein SCO1/2 [Catalinimonas alkaloidigena]